MEIETSDYQVWYDEAGNTIKCKGSFRLNGIDEYSSIIQLLNQAAEKHPAALTLDLRQLQFLNSSGINILLKFVISVRKRKEMTLVVWGSRLIPWQSKSLPNLQKLMPSLVLKFDPS
jgi:hypothetical protein